MTGVHLDIEISTNKNNYVESMMSRRDSDGDNTYYTEVRISARKEMSTAESMA